MHGAYASVAQAHVYIVQLLLLALHAACVAYTSRCNYHYFC